MYSPNGTNNFQPQWFGGQTNQYIPAPPNYTSTNGYSTTATQADIQRGFDTQAVTSKLNGLENGLCDGFYAMNTSLLTGLNTLQNAIQQNTVSNMQNANSLSSQLSNCCCENREAISQVRYDMATDTCAITTAINQASQNIMQNCNANYRQLHDEIVAIQMANKDEKIAEQAATIQALNLAASQQAQNAYLIQQLRNTGCNASLGCANCS